MPSFGYTSKEIKTIKDLKELLHELVDEHQMDDDAKIRFDAPWLGKESVHVYVGGDISYSENEISIDCEVR